MFVWPTFLFRNIQLVHVSKSNQAILDFQVSSNFFKKFNPNFFFQFHEIFEIFFNEFFFHHLVVDYTNESEVHWLSFELLIDSCPTASKCTSKGDVWAFATTLWELFSYGQSPTSLFETNESSSLSSKNNDKLLFKRAKEQV